jgi:glycine cleavage system aminomethyltransferase T
METIRQSPLAAVHRRLAAEMDDVHGWQLALRYTEPQTEAAAVRERAGLMDLSWVAKIDLKGFALNAPPLVPSTAACYHLGTTHYLAVCEPEERPSLESAIRQMETAPTALDLPQPVYATDVTSAFADLLLAGPLSRKILAKLTSLNISDSALPDRQCAQASVAHVRAIVLRRDLGKLPAFHLLPGRDYSESVWDAVMHAGAEFDLRPFGWCAYRLLSTEEPL